jgi:F0F1-type ATP synthase assembly protein I
MTGQERGTRARTRQTGVGGSGKGPTIPSVGEYAGVGLQFALTIVVFMFAGIWLDRTLGTSPWLLILFVFGGATAGFYSIYRKLMAAQRRADDERRAERERR